MNKKIVLLFVIIGLLACILNPAPAAVFGQNQGQIKVADSTIQPNYPLSLNFSCQVSNNANITDIRLQYQVEQMGFARVISEAKVPFSPAKTVLAKYSLNMLQTGQIPPGIGVDYWWIIKDASGNKLQTDPKHYTVVDNKHNWNSLTRGPVNLLWYGQNDAFGRAVMTTAESALSKLANDTGATPDRPINLSIYTSSQDYSSSVTGASEWSGGVTLLGYNAVLLLIRPTLVDLDLSGIAHELTHVIINQATFNPYNSLPFWLNEGLAMYIQYPSGILPSQFTVPFNNSVKNNSLISVRSLSSPFSAYADTAFLSYAESFSIVYYLINQYGSTKMLQFLNTFKQGSTYDGALQTNYGFDMDGLFTQWKVRVTAQNGN
jgi:hypothetical protein